MAALLEVKDLVVKYGEISAIKGISLKVEEGSLTTLLGNNGAGKSTLLKTISGLLKPFSGDIIFNGKSIVGVPAEKIVTGGIAQCPEGRKVFPRQTVHENLKLGAFTRRDREIESDIKMYYERFPILGERRNQQAGFLSGGEQQMLVIARALMARPKLLLLDEPSMGLAPKVVKMIFEIIEQVRSDGTTILLNEQNAKKALKIADYGYILDVGNITMHMDAQGLLNSDDVKQTYLGGAI